METELEDIKNDSSRSLNSKIAEASLKRELVLKNLVDSLRKENDELKAQISIKSHEHKRDQLMLKIGDLESEKTITQNNS